ncbi:hypothetical protein [Streptomyces sp. NPDC001422]|uniref:hypothetical protein n=1 Tax=Streptomyces sp. NPDC001422 TaxID=3364575 RepID=UPI0036A103A6
MTYEVQNGIRYKALAESYAKKLAAGIIRQAPLGPHRYTAEYAIKNNVKPYVSKTEKGWTGFVIIEQNPKARHAILQDQGFRDPAGRRHQGLFFIKKVLERERME